MNISNILGFVLSAAVFVTAVVMSSNNLLVFIDTHAILIVLGGTVATSVVCFSVKRITALLKVCVRRLLGRNAHDYPRLIGEIGALSKASLSGRQAFEEATKKVKDPFLADAASLLSWGDADVSDEHLRDLLETRAETHFDEYMSEAHIFKTMAKFPPAFGLMGTTLGMISLLQSLGSADSKTTMGPAMAIGLVATLYGVALTNFVLIPISENLAKQTREDSVARRMVVEGVMLIHSGLPSSFVEEKVKSFLLPSKRTARKAAA